MRKNLRKILLIVFIVAGVVFFNNSVGDNFLQNLFYRLAAKPGVLLAKGLAELSRYSKGLLNAGGIVDENRKLREENQVLLGSVAETEGLRRENDFLRSELGVVSKLESRLLMADVFSIQRTPLSSTALINKGRKDGVGERMALVARGSAFAGVVDEAFENSARVMLLDDPRLTVSVRVQGTDIIAETRGESGGKFRVNLVTHREEIGENDTLVTSGLDGLKEALPVGRVSEAGSSGGGLFRKITGEPFFDLSVGSAVFVILR
jgi:rod shape-determining protein MreC